MPRNCLRIRHPNFVLRAANQAKLLFLAEVGDGPLCSWFLARIVHRIISMLPSWRKLVLISGYLTASFDLLAH